MKEAKFKRKLRKIRRQGEEYKREQEIRDAYAEYWPDRKKRKVSNIMLTVSIICIVLYTIGCLMVQYFTSVEVSSALTTCFFSFFGGEIFLLAGIRVGKMFKENDNNIAE